MTSLMLSLSSKIKRMLTALFGSLLFLDGLFFTVQNKIHLGTLLPLVLGGFLLAYSYFYQQIQAILAQHPSYKMLWHLGWGLMIIWVISLLSFFVYLHQRIQQQVDVPELKAIIVLGSGIENGRPSAILAQRLNTAAALAAQQPQANIIVSGGLATREHATEAEIMAAYLQHTFHIPAHRIKLETESTSTELNLRNTQVILHNQHISLKKPIAIVTSDFHTLRAAAIARKQGYQHPIMVSAPTPLLNRYNAWLREYFAFISGWLLNEY